MKPNLKRIKITLEATRLLTTNKMLIILKETFTHLKTNKIAM